MQMALVVTVSAVLAGIGLPGIVAAADVESEVKELRERVDALERRYEGDQSESDEGQPNRPHPVHAVGAAKITGGLTTILQGASSSQLSPQSSAEASMSFDLFFEREISPSGLVLVYLGAQQGEGLTSVPMFTGPNADIEDPLGNQIKLQEAWYEHRWGGEIAILTVGKYDPTGFFDGNAFANDERSQFLANPFVNNPTISFGGDADGFGFGAVVRLRPTQWVEAAFGWEEGDGDFTDFGSRPFTIAELGFVPGWGGREGHYRFYGWTNRTLQPSLLGGTDSDNRGLGLSVDQQIANHLGAWVRYGSQDGSVAPFDRFAALGIDIGGGAFGREADGIGVGYAILAISDDYVASSGLDADEGYWEAYYRWVLSGDGVNQGVVLSPDVQLVTNAGGDASLDPIWIWGLRFQAYF